MLAVASTLYVRASPDSSHREAARLESSYSALSAHSTTFTYTTILGLCTCLTLANFNHLIWVWALHLQQPCPKSENVSTQLPHSRGQPAKLIRSLLCPL